MLGKDKNKQDKEKNSVRRLIFNYFKEKQVPYNYMINYSTSPDQLESFIYQLPHINKRFMVVIPKSKSVNIQKLQAITGYKPQKLEDKILKILVKCDVNYIPPFGSLWSMNTYIDRSIKHQKIIQFKIGAEGHDVTISYEDYFKVEKPYVVDISQTNQILLHNQIDLLNQQSQMMNRKGQLFEQYINNEINSGSNNQGNEQSYLETTSVYFDKAKQYTSLKDKEVSLLKHPEIILKINLPIQLDNGEKILLSSFRCQHSYSNRKPCLGDIIMEPNLTLQQMESLTMIKHYQFALFQIPFNGEKGGICADRKQFSKKELQRISAAYTKEYLWHGFMGPEQDYIELNDVIGNDERRVMISTYREQKGPEVINSTMIGWRKPEPFEPLDRVNEFQGIGVFHGVKLLLANKYYQDKLKLSEEIKGKTTIIQGFGDLGSQFASLWHENGGKVIGIIHEAITLHDPEGLPIPEILKEQKENQSISNFQKEEHSDLLFSDCDVLCLGEESAVNEANCHLIKAKVVVEATNGALTLYAHDHLMYKGIEIIPDLYVNGGTVLLKYFEWMRDLSNYRTGLTDDWNQEVANIIVGTVSDLANKPTGVFNQEGERVKDPAQFQVVHACFLSLMGYTLEKMMAIAEEKSICLRMAAYALLIENIQKFQFFIKAYKAAF